MAKKVLLRATDGTGSGFLFDRDDADKFMEVPENKGRYVVESEQETKAQQAEADAASADINAAGDKKKR